MKGSDGGPRRRLRGPQPHRLSVSPAGLDAPIELVVAASLHEALDALGYDSAQLLSRAAEYLYEEDVLANRATASQRQVVLGPRDQHRVLSSARLVDDVVAVADAPIEEGVAVSMDDHAEPTQPHWIGATRPVNASRYSDVIVAWRHEADRRLVRYVRVRDDTVAECRTWSDTTLTALAAYRARCARLGVVPAAWADEAEMRVARLAGEGLTRWRSRGPRARLGTIRARPARVATPIVGRERELDALGRVLAALPAIVTVSGEAGIGKTRFLMELVRRANLDSRPVFIGHCHALREPFSLGPVVEAVRQAYAPPRRWPRSTLAGALRPLMPEVADSLPPIPEISPDPATQRHVLFRAIAEVMGYAGAATWIFEDLHWADGMTLDFLRVLVESPPPSAAIFLTYRHEDVPQSSPVTSLYLRVPADVSFGGVELPVLTVAEVHRLVAAALGTDDVSEDVAAHVHERTGGLPFAVEEVAHLIKERMNVEEARGLSRRYLDELDVPTGIRDAVLQRVALLTASERRLVEAAAILDVPADPTLLGDVAGLDVTASSEALSRALENAVLVDHGASGYGLRHALAAQVVQESIPQSERKRLHRRAADALTTATPPPAARLAHHWHEAGAIAEWIHYGELAASQSLALCDDQAAVAQLIDLVGFAQQDSRDRARLAVRLGIAAMHGRARRLEVSKLLTSIAEDGTLPRTLRAELLYLVAVLQVGGVVWDRKQVAQCVDDLHHRPDLAVAAMVMLAWPWGPLGTLAEHRRWALRAVSTAVASRDPTLQLTSAAVLAQILTACGDAGAPAAIDRIPWGDADDVDLRRLVMANVGLAWSLTAVGENERARVMFDRAQQARRRVAYDQYLDRNLETLGVMRNFHLGEWHGLAARAARHCAATEESPDWWVPARIVIAELALARLELDNAARWFEEGRRGAAEAGLTPGVLEACAGIARIWLTRGKPEVALQTVQSGIELLMRKRIWVWGASFLPTAIEAMLACGDRAAAVALTTRFARGISSRRAPLAEAALLECRGLLAEADGRWSAAVGVFARAQNHYRASSCRYLEARVAERIGVCQLASDDRSDPSALLGAMQRFETLGAAGDAARVRKELRRFGVSVPRPMSQRRGRKSYGPALSPREQEVAGLALRGLSDEEIAARLYLSRRTVNHHVSSVLTKLGARSRRELPDLLSLDNEARQTAN